MSFYTALTGLNGSQADISATSNNIANVGTTGFKRSRAEFGDIFATSPLQNASSSIGSGTILKGIKQQFTQGNIASSTAGTRSGLIIVSPITKRVSYLLVGSSAEVACVLIK